MRRWRASSIRSRLNGHALRLQDARRCAASLFDYMEVFYNRQRRHSSNSYEAPLPFEGDEIALVSVSTVRGKIISRPFAVAAGNFALSGHSHQHRS